MKITKLSPPVHSVPDIPAHDAKGNRYVLQDVGSMFSGWAVSEKGRRYIFWANDKGAQCVFRERSGGQSFEQINVPPALSLAARQAVRENLGKARAPAAA